MARIINTSDLTRDSILSRNTSEWVYNGLDCCVTLEVLHALTPQLDTIAQRTYDFSRALQAPILEMSMRGMLVDQRRRREVLRSFKQKIDFLEGRLDRLCSEGIGTHLNWRSTPQLRSLLYDVLGLPAIRKRNAKGQMVPTVNRDAIERLSSYFIAEPICNLMLALRDLDKKRSWLETGIDPDGRMRTNYNIAGTNTGRLASAMSDFGTGGNMQNVDRELRSVFIADEGMKFCNIDLEQGDSRNVGAVCWNHFVESHGERFAGSYLDACESGDLHVAVARMVWPELAWTGDTKLDRALADVLFYRQDSYRQTSKKLGHATNFYGQPPFVAKQTKTERPKVEEFQRRYFAAFPCIGTFDKNDKTADNWHNHVRNQLRDHSQLTTLLGRRRYFFGRWFDDETLRGAIAYEPQSLTADEIDNALLKIWRAGRTQLLAQVHDSLLFQFSEEQEDEIVPWALELAKTRLQLAKGREFYVPVEAKTGWNWGEGSNENPDGLLKWREGDSRTRQEKISTLSFLNLLES